MENHLTLEVSQLVNFKISNLIRSEMQLLFKIKGVSSLQDLTEDIFENIFMGVMLGQQHYVNTFRLLYRVEKEMSYHKYKEIPLVKLFNWIGTEEIREFVLAKIREVALIESKYTFKDPKYVSEQSYFNEIIPNPSKNRQQKPEPQQQPKQMASSPATTDSSQRQNEQISYQHPEQEAENQQESDLFQMLNLNQQCETPPHQKRQEKSQLNLCGQDLLEDVEEKLEERAKQGEKSMEQEGLHGKGEIVDCGCQAEESEQNQYTVIKLAIDQRKEEEEDHLISEVSSFDHDSNYLNLNSYELQDTGRFGHLLYGDRIDKILRSFNSKEMIFMMIKWLPRKDGTVPMESILDASTLKEHSPKILIEYYENQMK